MLPSTFLSHFLLPLTAHSFTALSPTSLPKLRAPTQEDFSIAPNSGGLLSPILIPRVPGTPGSLKVLTHFNHFFTSELPLWNLSTQNSTQTTPVSNGKEVPFVNFFATRDPPWKKEGDVGRLVLVAHYDSKITPKDFIGAIDSAVPCAVLMHAARAVDSALTRRWEAVQKRGDIEEMEEEQGVMVLFLDGEEAFEQWTDEDSLYGARNLAEHWDTTYHAAMSNRKTHLESIDLFVLFDLLGASHPQIPSYFRTTHWAYIGLSDTEAALKTAKLRQSTDNTWFPDSKKSADSFWGGFIQDDHIPFIARGVEVLHLIPGHFPDQWHEITDDGEHLDGKAVLDWAWLAAASTAGFMKLEDYLGDGKDATFHGKRGMEGMDSDAGLKSEL